MELANLILEYIKTLVWPLLVGFALWRFRSPIRRLLDRIASESQEFEAFGLKTKLRGASPEEQAKTLQNEVRLLQAGDQAADEAERRTQSTAEPPLDARERYLLAEELVLRALEVRWSAAIARHQIVDLPGGRGIEFDGVLYGAQQVILIEVKLLSRPAIPHQVLRHMSEQLFALRHHFGKMVVGFIAFVAPEDAEQYHSLPSDIQRSMNSVPSPIFTELFYLPRLMTEFLGTQA
jgi:hypothetical protein